MVRIMVCIMIVCLSAAGGYLYSWKFTRRTAVIGDAREKLNTMEREIMFSMDTLPDICIRLSKEEGPFSKVFGNIGRCIEMESEPFERLWSRAIREAAFSSSLKKDQLESLSSLGRGLGKGDIYEQKKCFARINSELEKLFSEADEECRRLKKMYMSLFVSGGMAVSIILI